MNENPLINILKLHSTSNGLKVAFLFDHKEESDYVTKLKNQNTGTPVDVLTHLTDIQR